MTLHNVCLLTRYFECPFLSQKRKLDAVVIGGGQFTPDQLVSVAGGDGGVARLSLLENPTAGLQHLRALLTADNDEKLDELV